MRKVYVLMSGIIDDDCVLGVFSSKKKVDEARTWLINNDTYYKSFPNDLYVDVFELNGERIEE